MLPLPVLDVEEDVRCRLLCDVQGDDTCPSKSWLYTIDTPSLESRRLRAKVAWASRAASSVSPEVS